MTGARGGTASGAGPGRWHVALSFAGAQRDYVEQVAAVLKQQGVRCFYDADEEIELWGKSLAEVLPVIYGEQAAAVVVFVSAEYAARDWTRLERQAAVARSVRERREYVLPARFDDTQLPGLLPDVSYVDLSTKTPQQFAALVAAKLTALGIASSESTVDAEGPGQGARSARPMGAVQVRMANPRRLGVHAAISVPGVPDEVPPEYVLRDVDATEQGVRARVAVAGKRGGFVLLVGGSSVGKTRCAVEAVQALLPDWWLVHPAGPGEIAELSAAPLPRVVVWLDELQRYLDGERGLTGAVVRALLNAPGPVVIIGTLRPDQYAVYTAVAAPGGADPHAREREVLDLAEVFRIRAQFSAAERERSRLAAARDRRLRVALAAGYGLTQTLAAAPQLVARWDQAQATNPYAWAVLTAALDAARLGARAPLSAGLLRAAAPGYCTSQQQAEAPADWFEQALAYATEKQHGAAAPLAPAGTGMGQTAGYTAAAYLVHYAARERRNAPVPTSTWDALLSHIQDPADAEWLARSAGERLLYCYAIPLCRLASDANYFNAAVQLAELLAGRGDLDELRARADAGDNIAANKLAELKGERGDLEELLLASLPDEPPTDRLADLGEHELRTRTDAGDQNAAYVLADLLNERGDLDEALDVLRVQADSDGLAAMLLAELLAKHGYLDELRARADAADWCADYELAKLLAEREDLDELRARTDAGDHNAALRLADLLGERGELYDARRILRNSIQLGNRLAGERLAELLTQQGPYFRDEAEQLRRFGLNPDGSTADK